MAEQQLSPLAASLIKAFQRNTPINATKGGISVNPVISEIASWYEKVRNAMDYREEEVVLRAAIERILRRKFLFGGSGQTVAPPLIRELVWARYFPNDSVPESIIERVSQTIDNYLHLRAAVMQKTQLKEVEVSSWTYHLLSCEIAQILRPNHKKEIMCNFVFHVLKDNVVIEDKKEAVRDAQVFIAVRRAFAKDDLAFLRYCLFKQYFGELTEQNVGQIAEKFEQGYKEIEAELNFPVRHRVISYVKKQIPPLLILEDILLEEDTGQTELFTNQEKLEEVIKQKCDKRYAAVVGKVHRAIIRSVIFIILTKTIIALGIEGVFDNIVYGHIMWDALVLNIAIPPILMIIASFFIRVPKEENTKVIIARIESLLYQDRPVLGKTLRLSTEPPKNKSLADITFSVLWLIAFLLSFGTVVYILNLAHFNIISQGVFVFFLTVVAFLIYRIHQTAKTYTVISKQGLFTPIVDFFFLPIAQVGRSLTEGFSQVNIFLFILDFLIETPFKTMFGFFEQWFMFLHAKREYLE